MDWSNIRAFIEENISMFLDFVLHPANEGLIKDYLYEQEENFWEFIDARGGINV